MVTTFFKPSIHGWPFGNSWTKSFLFDSVTLSMGFCGGMCWRSLQRFFNAIPIYRDIEVPTEGDLLYEELWEAQVNSVPLSTLWKIFDWQQRPDQSHIFCKHSLGHLTQLEWKDVKKKLDNLIPVTLTLITSSNDYNLFNLEHNHRVVAIGYELEDVVVEHGVPTGADKKVTLNIYDPNQENDDGVYLTFYLGGEKSKIKLRHNRGLEVHGFFVDDKVRDYKYADSSWIKINKGIQIGFISDTLVEYDINFSWQSQIIPYFKIQINGLDWESNTELFESLLPLERPNKQCLDRNGYKELRVKLPRDISKISFILLDNPNISCFTEINAKPGILCLPYIRERSKSDMETVYESSFESEDLYIKDSNPSASDIRLFSQEKFRFVYESVKMQENSHLPNGFSCLSTEIFRQYSLGNICVPIKASFKVFNMPSNFKLYGDIEITNSDGESETIHINNMVIDDQFIFEGFKNNPDDYSNDKKIEFRYIVEDNFGKKAGGSIFFYGRSIICKSTIVGLSLIDFDKIGKIQSTIKELVESGLINIVTNYNGTLTTIGPSLGLQNPFSLKKKLRQNKRIQSEIDRVVNKSWDSQVLWNKCIENQKIISTNEIVDAKFSFIGSNHSKDQMEAIENVQKNEQNLLDGELIRTFVDYNINVLKKNLLVKEFLGMVPKHDNANVK